MCFCGTPYSFPRVDLLSSPGSPWYLANITVTVCCPPHAFPSSARPRHAPSRNMDVSCWVSVLQVLTLLYMLRAPWSHVFLSFVFCLLRSQTLPQLAWTPNEHSDVTQVRRRIGLVRRLAHADLPSFRSLPFTFLSFCVFFSSVADASLAEVATFAFVRQERRPCICNVQP